MDSGQGLGRGYVPFEESELGEQGGRGCFPTNLPFSPNTYVPIYKKFMICLLEGLLLFYLSDTILKKGEAHGKRNTIR